MTQLPEGYQLRLGTADDIPLLQKADLAASRLFERTGLINEPEGPEPIPADVLEKGISNRLLFVISAPFETPVGYAVTSIRHPDLYLDQISVDPAHGKRGLGAILLNKVIETADASHLKGVILSTFRDVPWNGPFYAKHGFVEIPRRAMKGWMKDLETIQAETMDTSLRCFMRRPGKWDRHWIRPHSKRKLERT